MKTACPALRRPARTRFAPSPTGELHIGHAYSALTAWRVAGQSNQLFCLRIDDLDHTRCRPAYKKQMIEDLNWLGLSWAEAPLIQSTRLQRYKQALEQLQSDDVIYPCYLSRRELAAVLSAPQDDGTSQAPVLTRKLAKKLLPTTEQSQKQKAGQIPAWRLDSQRALHRTGPLFWQGADGQKHQLDKDQFEQTIGDVILGRRDIGASYHLSVVVDDADSQMEIIVRGEDLAESTAIHRLLQALLGLPAPGYLHHPLVRDDTGRRLAKRNLDRSLLNYRQNGMGPEDVIALMPDLII